MYRFPLEQAAKIALDTVRAFVEDNPEELDLVKWVLFDGRTKRVYDETVGI